jgi:hypothetical protein
MAGDRMAYDSWSKRFPGAAAIVVEPVAAPRGSGGRPMSTSASESFRTRFPGAAKVLNEYGR